MRRREGGGSRRVGREIWTVSKEFSLPWGWGGRVSGSVIQVKERRCRGWLGHILIQE